ncbi:MAG: erythromycin biosynthesis sensory transduction protein eryC1 [Verrucomicrobia bacterium 13_1_20CM_4_54_11]|nr:MAG: erythromycin biosynthesis sensory transduction protein eryC1 [Verrucomicrobia bacterium 13_1_20CM_4_54_11]
MKVPFLDLKAHHAPLTEEFDRAIREVIESSAFAGGPFVERFEEEFASFCGSSYAIGVGNGTDALWLALLALGIGEGDEVITVPNTFIATAEAITYCKARPVFVDVDPDTFTMNPAELEKSLTKKTKAIIPVHLFGQPADMDPILEFARANGLFVVEDAAQAHGAQYKGQKAGTMGDAGCFSFYPGKNLGAFGEAGAVVTNDPELRKQIQMLRDHGQSRKYYHSTMGWNCRMDGIQAAILSVKLSHLDKANSLRRKHALEYNQAFAGIDEVLTPFEAKYARHVYHVYAVRVQERDAVLRHLQEKGVGCAVHYPVPVHLQEAGRNLGSTKGAFPIAEKLADEFLSLPMFPELTEEQIEYVGRCVSETVGVEALA